MNNSGLLPASGAIAYRCGGIRNGVRMKRRRFTGWLAAYALGGFSLRPRVAGADSIGDRGCGSRALVVYVTRTRNTEQIARMIVEMTGADSLALELENPYPADYQAHVDRAKAENEQGILPALRSTEVDLSRFDTVFVGFPTWGMQLPSPMKRFLQERDLSGKHILPFNTHAEYGVGRGFREVADLCPASHVHEGLSVQGGYERRGLLLAIEGERAREVAEQVRAWLARERFEV